MSGKSYVNPVVFSESRQCGNKLAFSSHQEAKRAMAHARKKWGSRDLICYQCPHCGYWHMGRDTFRHPLGIRP